MAGAVRSFACSHFAAKQSPAARAPKQIHCEGCKKRHSLSLSLSLHLTPHAPPSESWRCCAFCALHYLEKITTLLSVLNELCATGCVCVLLRNYLNCVVARAPPAARPTERPSGWLRRCLLFAFKNRSSSRAVCHCLLKISAQIIITDGPFNA
jgi:hypothetical protein